MAKQSKILLCDITQSSRQPSLCPSPPSCCHHSASLCGWDWGCGCQKTLPSLEPRQLNGLTKDWYHDEKVLFLATLVALHFTPVSEWVSHSFGLQPSSNLLLVPYAKEIWFHFQTNPCKSFPEFEAISMRGPDASFKGKEIWFHFETNPYDWFPKFEAVGESPFNFEGVFRHFVMNFSDSFWLQTSFKAYGRANPSKKVSCNQFSLSWGPSKIPQPLSGGRHTRLRVRNKSK